MSSDKKAAGAILLLVFIFSLGGAFAINLPTLQSNFPFADEAIYIAMTLSLAHDGDLEYTARDLHRYFQVMEFQPMGIFLKKGKNDKIFYAKSFAYPLFAAPFVKILDINGFLVLHAFLLGLILAMGYLYLSVSNNSLFSLASAMTFLFASVAVVYFLWISPDFFSLFLSFASIFLWLYKQRCKDSPHAERPGGRLHRFLLSGWSDVLACILIAIAVYTKPPNILLIGILVLHALFKKKFVKAGLMVLIFLVVSGLFWGANHLVTGDWNYQGGERKSFYFHYPLEKENVTFDEVGYPMTAEGYGARHLLPVEFTAYNLFYYFFGRYAGITWYFFPAFLALILFFGGRRRFSHWLIFAAIAGEILIYIVLMPDNYSGGGGAIANRYFLNIFPLFFFLSGAKMRGRDLVLCWIMASVFISQIMFSPLQHSRFPSIHVKKWPFKLLPVELTLYRNFPTNTNPDAFRRQVGKHPHIGWLYFLDDNFNPKQEGTGFWIKGSRTAEMVLETAYPVETVIFHLRSNRRLSNEITVQVWGEKKKIILQRNQWGALPVSPKKVFRMKDIHLYKIKVRAEKETIPYFEEEESLDKRSLGVFLELEILPENAES